MRRELQIVLEMVGEMEPAELPKLMGEIEEIRVTALARLSSPAQSNPLEDRYLSVDEAAAIWGMSKEYIYHHHKEFSFIRHEGRNLRVSSLGLQKHIRQQKTLDSKLSRGYAQSRRLT